jgi:hypothetical protein
MGNVPCSGSPLRSIGIWRSARVALNADATRPPLHGSRTLPHRSQPDDEYR